MTDEPLALSPSAPPSPTEADYEAIAAAVMGTVRGRWFLAEYAKRNRNADSALIIERIDRIEELLHEAPAISPAERVRIDLVEMAKAIARTRSEIAAIKPDGDAKGTLSEASEELDSIVNATERATSDILAAAEQVQEIGWTLRERGADGAICDALDQRATDIYSACSFQDLTGQRIRKVVDVLQFLEDRIRAMIEIWGGAVPDEDGTSTAVAAPHVGEDRTVPHLEQRDIDRMMPPAPPDVANAEAQPRAHDVAAAAGERRPDRWTQPGAAEQPAVAAGIAASTGPGPAGGIAMVEAARAVATAGPAEGAAAVEPTAADTVMTPGMAVVGATALALDLLPTAIVRQPQIVPQAEAQPEPKAEAQVEAHVVPQEPEAEAQVEARVQAEPQAEAQVEAQAGAEARSEPEPEAGPEPELRSQPATAIDAPPEAAPHPAPPSESVSEPTPEIEADAAPREPRADPAAVLQRILAIIRAPSDPAAGSAPAEGASAPSVAATHPDEGLAAPEPEAAVTAAVSILAPAVAHIEAAHGAAADALSVDVAAADYAPADRGAVQPGEPAEFGAATGVIEETRDDIPMPLAGPLTVDQAVDAMLKAPGRGDVRPTRAAAGTGAPAEALGGTRATAEPADPAAESAAAAGSQSPIIIEVPEFTVTTRAPPPAAPAPEAAPAAETVAAHLAPPDEPAPQAASDELGAAVAAEAAAPPEQPPVEPVTAAPEPLVSPEPPAATAEEPPPPVAPPAASVAEAARPVTRHPALAAITALSDEEKIALFS